MMVKLGDALKQPVSLINMAMIIIAGSGLYFAIIGRLDRQEMINQAQARVDADQTQKIEEGRRERREELAKVEAAIKAVDQKADAKLELIQRDVGEIRGALREMNANLQWIVRQQGGPPSTISPR